LVDHYKVLGIKENATIAEIKRAFREKAKRLHPDLAASSDTGQMQILLSAYEVLSNRERRFQYDMVFKRAGKQSSWNYRDYLREHADDPECQAKRIFFELLHFGEDTAIEVWQDCGGINFPLRKFLGREDWMDCAFLLAEELEKRHCVYESFLILVQLLVEERKNAYFRHFTFDVELLLKELIRLKLRRAVDDKTWVECLRSLLQLGFPVKEEARWLKSISETLFKIGDKTGALEAYYEAKKRDAKIYLSNKVSEGLEL
jgi:curved DNA-binding protein CbpA